MFVPASQGGHPRYAVALLSAIAKCSDIRLVYVGPVDVALPPHPRELDVQRVLPAIPPPAGYRFKAVWAASRLLFYTRRDLVLARWLLRRKDVCVLHLQEPIAPWMLPLVLLVAAIRRQTVVATIHNVRPHASASSLSRARDRLSLTGLSRFGAIFVHRGVDLDDASKQFGVDPAEIVEIQHGIFEEACQPPRRDQRVLLFFGSWRRNKGLAQLIEAMRLLGHSWQLLVVGTAVEPLYASECVRMAPKNVVFREGYVPEEEIAAVFERSSACVLPYTQLDAQSGVLHLAIGCGRPVVVTPVGGMAPVVARFGCGTVAEGISPAQIAAAVDALFDCDIFDAASEGVTRARVSLGWVDAAKATLAVYEEGVRGRRDSKAASAAATTGRQRG